MKNIRIYKSKIIREQFPDSDLQALITDFKRYKSGQSLPDLFGRDVLYDHSNTPPIIKTEEVRHLHLATPETPWKSQKAVQFSKTSDTHLVYCQAGSDPNSYLLIAVLSPDAHEQAKQKQLMITMGMMAETFRNRF